MVESFLGSRELSRLDRNARELEPRVLADRHEDRPLLVRRRYHHGRRHHVLVNKHVIKIVTERLKDQ